MTDISFYHLQRSPLEQALPKLLERTLASDKRAFVLTGSEARSEALNGVLWTYDQDSWLPHGTKKDGNAGQQPVWIDETPDNQNDARFLFLTDGAVHPDVSTFERCFELFDGNDDDAVARARVRWKAYLEAGHDLAYWQQNERGGWEQRK